MAYSAPVAADFKTFFNRDFQYGGADGDLSKVQDADISRAISESAPMINEGLFPSQAEFTTAYFYLAAHALVINLKNSTQGVSGIYSWMLTSRGVSSVSQGFTVPESILKNPLLSQLSQTQYGAKYLSLVLGYLSGGVGIVCGATQA